MVEAFYQKATVVDGPDLEKSTVSSGREATSDFNFFFE